MSQLVVPKVPVVPETQPAGLADKVGTAIGVFAPLPVLVVAIINGWMLASVVNVTTCVILYYLIGFGVSAGFHRLFTHRSFQTTPAIRVLLAVLGTAAVEGPIINWVANHRKHHAYTDVAGDPHSPHNDGGLRGFWHAHVGWLFAGERASHQRYASDLLKDPAIVRVNSLFKPIMMLSVFVLPFLIGFAIYGSLRGGLGMLLWGGVLRVFLYHHSTWSVNSACHLFGKRPFASGDHSTNNRWVACLVLGEGWHNAHHAFPRSAKHGLLPWQYDPTWWFICLLRRYGWAWNVQTPSQAQMAAKAIK